MDIYEATNSLLREVGDDWLDDVENETADEKEKRLNKPAFRRKRKSDWTSGEDGEPDYEKASRLEIPAFKRKSGDVIDSDDEDEYEDEADKEARLERPTFRRKYGDYTDVKDDKEVPTHLRNIKGDSLAGKVHDVTDLNIDLGKVSIMNEIDYITTIDQVKKELNVAIPNRGIDIKSKVGQFIIVVKGIPSSKESRDIVMNIMRDYYDTATIINKG